MSTNQFANRAVPKPRSCGDCTLCCKVLRVADLDKPAGTWCEHCDTGKGCRIYADRPGSCRSFMCSYLQDNRLGEEWRPRDSKIVLQHIEGDNCIMVHVDPQRPNAWKAEPFHSAMRNWARGGVAHLFQVLVIVGRRIHVVLPNRDVDLGELPTDKIVQLYREPGARPDQLQVRVVDRDDPSVPKLTPSLLGR
ncbi:MAG TPA: hypothetical protein VHL34_08930 [Rhizomicrobium sp.]|jgi:hypothetical protein|nr:hypothetical protein [Rhizomicrobium sp.]